MKIELEIEKSENRLILSMPLGTGKVMMAVKLETPMEKVWTFFSELKESPQ